MSSHKDNYHKNKPKKKKIEKTEASRFASVQIWGSIIASVLLIAGAVCIGIFVKAAITKWVLIAATVIGIVVIWLFAIKEGFKIKKHSKKQHEVSDELTEEEYAEEEALDKEYSK